MMHVIPAALHSCLICKHKTGFQIRWLVSSYACYENMHFCINIPCKQTCKIQYAVIPKWWFTSHVSARPDKENYPTCHYSYPVTTACAVLQFSRDGIAFISCNNISCGVSVQAVSACKTGQKILEDHLNYLYDSTRQSFLCYTYRFMCIATLHQFVVVSWM